MHFFGCVKFNNVPLVVGEFIRIPFPVSGPVGRDPRFARGGGWLGFAGLLSQVLVMLLYRRLGDICGKMERFPRASVSGERRR